MTIMKERKLYKIGQLTRLLGITSRTLRYYDQTGILPHVKRSTGGMRLFDDEDLDIIKRVRRIQNKEKISLEEIRNRLYGQPSSIKTAIVITDGGASIPSELLPNLPIQIIPVQLQAGDLTFNNAELPLDEFWSRSRTAKQQPELQAPSVDVFTKAYQACADAGYTQIYSIHTSSLFSDAHDNAKKAAGLMSDQVTITVYDSKSIGSGLGLLVSQIAEAVTNEEPVEQINSLITKQLPMTHLLCMADSVEDLAIGNVIPIQHTPSAGLMEKMFKFKPVFTIQNRTGEISILDCCITKEHGIEIIMEALAREISLRGKYINRIMVGYNYMYGEATNLVNQVKLQYPNVPVFIQEDTGIFSVFAGPRTVTLSVA